MHESASIRIAKAADAYLAAPPAPHRSADLSAVREDFLNAFFEGFTNPAAQTSSPNNAAFYGFIEGQNFRSRHSAEEKEVMLSFGYTSVAIRGFLFFGRELGFTPENTRGDRWEVADPILRDEGWPADADRKDGMAVIFSGYLSPEKYYGQRFVGDRKIYVLKTEIVGR